MSVEELILGMWLFEILFGRLAALLSQCLFMDSAHIFHVFFHYQPNRPLPP
jgi:hypothetical protein